MTPSQEEKLLSRIDSLEEDVRILTGLVAFLGSGIQYLAKQSNKYYNSWTSNTYPNGIMRKVSFPPTVIDVTGYKPSKFSIPALRTLWDTVFSTTAWKDL